MQALKAIRRLKKVEEKLNLTETEDLPAKARTSGLNEGYAKKRNLLTTEFYQSAYRFEDKLN